MESQERKMRRGRHGQTAASLCPSTQTPKAGKFPNIGRGSRCQVAACHLPQSILLVAQHRPASLVLYLHSQKGRARPAQTNAPGWYDLMLSPLPQGACDRLISYCARLRIHSLWMVSVPSSGPTWSHLSVCNIQSELSAAARRT